VTQILQNSAACGYTVLSSHAAPYPNTFNVAIKDAANASFLANGTSIAPQLSVSSLTMILVGNPVVQSTTTVSTSHSDNGGGNGGVSGCGSTHGEDCSHGSTMTTTVSTQ
jgi:hypothetical protein